VPEAPILPDLRGGVGDPGRVGISISESGGGSAHARVLSVELRAFTEPELGSALEAALRAVTVAAAATDAVLELRAVRRAGPRAWRSDGARGR
jgi:hypothetical protein